MLIIGVSDAKIIIHVSITTNETNIFFIFVKLFYLVFQSIDHY